MKTHAQIIRGAGKVDDVALLCGVTIFAVKSWVQRDSIPGDKWATLAKAGYATLEELAEAASSVKAA